MEQVIIGDIHGRTLWWDIIQAHPNADRYIFLADYVDTLDDITKGEQLNNLHRIIEFKKANPDRVVCLIGNHDFQYFSGVDQRYQGYQPRMRPMFEWYFQMNYDLFEMCFIDEYDTVYSHAGFTKTWVRLRLEQGFSKQAVDELWYYRRLIFGISNYDDSGCGDSVYESPIWVRPNSLYRDKISKFQVVGHTGVTKIHHPAKAIRRGFFVADALEHYQYLLRQNETFTVMHLDRSLPLYKM